MSRNAAAGGALSARKGDLDGRRKTPRAPGARPYRSDDGGRSWTDITQGIPTNCSAHEIAVSPANPLDIVVIGSAGWNGRCLRSTDGGRTWTDASHLAPDSAWIRLYLGCHFCGRAMRVDFSPLSRDPGECVVPLIARATRAARWRSAPMRS